MAHIINYENKDIVSEEHVCYYTRESSESKSKIILMEMTSQNIMHPDSEGQCLFQRYDNHIIGEFYRHEVPEAVILEAAETNIRQLENKLKILRNIHHDSVS